jgi:hypothetical protein
MFIFASICDERPVKNQSIFRVSTWQLRERGVYRTPDVILEKVTVRDANCHLDAVEMDLNGAPGTRRRKVWSAAL